MADLSTQYLGLKLKTPLVVSASPLSERIDNIRQMEDSGAGAVVLESLFEEQIALESQQLDLALSSGTESFAESLSYFPDMSGYNLGPDGYLEHIRRAKAAVEIPIIASLNGVSIGGWIEYAKKMEQAGADALELNIYFVPTDLDMTGAQVDQMYVDLLTQVKSGLSIPLAVKLGPFFSSVANLAKRLDAAGANGLVLFNRFYQADFDLETLEVTPNLTLSNPYEILLRIHWVACLYGHIKADLAVTGGVHSAKEVLKSMMAGARVAMMASALLKNGIGHLKTVLAELQTWMDEHEYESVKQMQGSMSQRAVDDPSAFQRANYMRVLSSYALRSPAPGAKPA
ncbi:MAG TPA: dihydroorotate dehydrogenase-like protein [Terriglobia bacterium]|jgi:dihydroorotate dehydrogenase (fumarate)|nr:dihydroorotate dehydrogenase-like protein [Terriglobia bacterium]